LSTLRAVPMWRLIDQAIRGLVETLPDAERRLVVQMAAHRARVQPDAS